MEGGKVGGAQMVVCEMVIGRLEGSVWVVEGLRVL